MIPWGGKRGVTVIGHKGTFWVMKIFCIVTVMVVTCLYIFVNTHQIIHL